MGLVSVHTYRAWGPVTEARNANPTPNPEPTSVHISTSLSSATSTSRTSCSRNGFSTGSTHRLKCQGPPALRQHGEARSLFSVPPFCHCFYFNKSLLVLSWWHMSGSKISNALENVFAAVFMYLTLRRERKEHYMEVRGCMGRPDYKTVNKITCSPED